MNKYDEASIEKLNKLREDYEYLADELREFDEVIVTVASQKIVVAATVTSILAKLQREGL